MLYHCCIPHKYLRNLYLQTNLKGIAAVSKNELALLIEKKRAELIQTAAQYGLCSSAAITRSQELDLLLNEYHRNIQTKPKKMFRIK